MILDIKIIDNNLNINQLLKDDNLLKKIKTFCSKKNVIIVKSIFNKEYLDKILKFNKSYFRKSTPIVPESYSFNLDDFYRIDKNVKNSKINKNQTIYFYPLYKKNVNVVRKLTKQLSLLRNKIAGLNYNYGCASTDKHVGIGVIQHYPNNGFMAEHFDPKYPQKVVVSAILHDDYSQGGLSLCMSNKFINLDKFIQKGDIVIHAPDILHRVELVKTKSTKAFAGRWRASSVLLPIN